MSKKFVIRNKSRAAYVASEPRFDYKLYKRCHKPTMRLVRNNNKKKTKKRERKLKLFAGRRRSIIL